MTEYNNNINVGSYGNLDEGSNIIRKTSNELKTDLEHGDGYLRNIQRPRIFEGPVADHVSGVWDVINRATTNNINEFENSANTLNAITANYHSTDKKSSNDIGGVI